MTVEELLVKKGIFFTIKGNDYLIHCLNPEHEDRSPSCRVDKISGVFHCFSCSFRGNLFTLFSIPRDRSSEKVNELLKRIEKIRLGTQGVQVPSGSVPFSRDYRGISAETYIKFEAFLNTTEYQNRLAFPIKDITERIAFIHTRTLQGSPKDKYKNYPSGVPTFPFPQNVKPLQGSILLVEGLFDLLNLYDKGLKNTICSFGTSTLAQERISDALKVYRLQGVEKIYVLFDGDVAGRKASGTIMENIKLHTMFSAEEVFLDEQDPGDMSLEDVTRLKSMLYEDNDSD